MLKWPGQWTIKTFQPITNWGHQLEGLRCNLTSKNGKCPDMKFPGNDCVLDLEHPAALSSRLGGGEDLEVQDLHGEQFNLSFLLRWLWELISNSIWIWRKIFVQLLTWFNQDQPYPQLANFEYQTRTEVTIFFYIVKLCTLLNRLPEPPYWNISTWTVPSKYLDLGCTIEISRLGLYHQNISTNGKPSPSLFRALCSKLSID